MGLEIERRFLVTGNAWRAFAASSKVLRQGYLATSKKGFTVRVRILSDIKAWLTLKTPSKGIAVHEFEYMIPLMDAQNIWNLTSHRVYKKRYKLSLRGGDWIVDCFEEKNAPLVLAEVELSSINDPLEIPAWCWHEVTGQSQWSNASLAQMPIAEWTTEKKKVFKVLS